MLQIVLQEPGQLRLVEVEPPAGPKPGEALVRVKRVGICGTDLHAFRGMQPFFTYPRVIGHELGVEVMEVGAGVTEVRSGDLCAVAPYLDCGECIACRQGKMNCCVSLKVLGVHIDGGLREYFTLPARKLLPSRKLSAEQLALVEMLGIGAHAVARSQLKQHEWAMIIGAGPIGLATAQFAVATGAQVLVMDINRDRLEFCRSELGVQHLVHLKNGEEPAPKIGSIVPDGLPSVVFDVTGNPGSMMKAFELVAHGGRLVLVGHTKGEITFQNPNFHKRELTVLSSRNATDDDLRSLIGMIEEGKIRTDPWITHRVPLSAVTDNFPAWLRPETGVIKAIVEVA